MKFSSHGLFGSTELDTGEPEKWVYTSSQDAARRYMDVTYKCGCTIRSYHVAEWTCEKHHKSIKKIVRVEEYD